MLFGGQPHKYDEVVGKWEEVLVEGDRLPEGTELAPVALKTLMSNFCPNRYPAREEMSRKPWQRDGDDLHRRCVGYVDDLVERGNEQALREVYETWVGRYEFFKHIVLNAPRP